jgi:hypothetical protein
LVDEPTVAVREHSPNVLLIARPDEGHQTSYADTVTALDFVIHAAERDTPSM